MRKLILFADFIGYTISPMTVFRANGAYYDRNSNKVMIIEDTYIPEEVLRKKAEIVLQSELHPYKKAYEGLDEETISECISEFISDCINIMHDMHRCAGQPKVGVCVSKGKIYQLSQKVNSIDPKNPRPVRLPLGLETPPHIIRELIGMMNSYSIPHQFLNRLSEYVILQDGYEVSGDI